MLSHGSMSMDWVSTLETNCETWEEQDNTKDTLLYTIEAPQPTLVYE